MPEKLISSHSHDKSNSSKPWDADSRLFLRLLAVLTFLFLLGTAFRNGWTRQETDFPNYYTGAVAIRQGLPLHNFYDWTWFQRQINYAGVEHQLGGYSPFTPLTALPMLGLTNFPMQTAKRIWLVLNLLFLGATVWMLSRVTRFRFETIWLMMFCGYFSLYNNFLFGQYYVFLLFLLTLVFYFLHQKNFLLSGSAAGIAFGLKLYGGPFLLYFCARRHWKAALGMAVAIVLLILLAIALFGPGDIYFYASQVLPRALESASPDPYSPGLPTFSNWARHLFVAEPELNPHPILEAPWLFFFLRTFFALTIVALFFLGTSTKRATERHDFAWFSVAVILLSTSVSSYTFILLLLPVVLLLEESESWERVLLFGSYVLLTLPLPGGRLFPKVWLLLALFVALGWRSWRQVPQRVVFGVFACIALIAFVDARRHMESYAKEPGRHFERIAVRKGAIFSSFPVISSKGLFYQSIGKDSYVLRWLHDGQNEELAFEGLALHPRLAPDGQAISFELVANRVSTMMQFDPSTRKVIRLGMTVPGDSADPVLSPDGKWAAFTSTRNGPEQIWIRNVSSGYEKQLTGGNCNSSAPAWELDSKAIVFASDCDRAFGLSALYRAQILAFSKYEENENKRPLP